MIFWDVECEHLFGGIFDVLFLILIVHNFVSVQEDEFRRQVSELRNGNVQSILNGLPVRAQFDYDHTIPLKASHNIFG